MNSFSIYIVRHGITEWNRQERMQGHSDIPLDAEGRIQAEKISCRLAEVRPKIQQVWSSDLSRAVETAEAIARPLGIAIATTPLLRETDLGEWEGLTREDIQARGEGDKLEAYRKDPYLHRPPGGETLDSAWARMNRVLEDIRNSAPSLRIAIVGHGGSLRALIGNCLEMSPWTMRHISLDNASLSIIEESGSNEYRMIRLCLLNDVSHLRCINPSCCNSLTR